LTLRQRIAEWTLPAAAVSALPIAALAPLGLAPLLLAAALSVAIGDGAAAFRRLSGRGAAFGALAFLAAWGGISSIWSVKPDWSLAMALRMALTFAASAVLVGRALDADVAERRKIAIGLIVGTASTLAFVAAEVWSERTALNFLRSIVGEEPAPVVVFNRFATALSILVWPGFFAVLRYGARWPAWALLALAAAVTAVLPSTTAMLAFAAGGLTTFAAHRAPSPVRRLAAVAVVGAVLVAPLAAGVATTAVSWAAPSIKPSAVHRLVIWEFAADRIADRPILGWGLDTVRVLPDADREIAFETKEGVWLRQRLPLHTHNAALQIWVELGLVGAIGLVGLVLGVLGAIATVGDRFGHAISLGTFVAAVTVALASYGIWQFWWLANLGIAAALTIALNRAADSPPRRSAP
jgi:O-antigen ligase